MHRWIGAGVDLEPEPRPATIRPEAGRSPGGPGAGAIGSKHSALISQTLGCRLVSLVVESSSEVGGEFSPLCFVFDAASWLEGAARWFELGNWLCLWSFTGRV